MLMIQGRGNRMFFYTNFNYSLLNPEVLFSQVYHYFPLLHDPLICLDLAVSNGYPWVWTLRCLKIGHKLAKKKTCTWLDCPKSAEKIECCLLPFKIKKNKKECCLFKWCLQCSHHELAFGLSQSQGPCASCGMQAWSFLFLVYTILNPHAFGLG